LLAELFDGEHVPLRSAAQVGIPSLGSTTVCRRTQKRAINIRIRISAIV